MLEVRKIIHWDHDPYAGLDLLPEEIAGWVTSTSEVFKHVIDKLKPKRVIEVGSWYGKSAIHMAELMREYTDDFEIVCVDTWLGSMEHWINDGAFHDGLKNGKADFYQQFLSNVVHKNLQNYITPFPIDSMNAAEFFKEKQITADLVYIDAGHEYFSVKCDLYSYSTIVRPGGMLLGDDWFHEPIKRAAYDTFGEEKIIELSRDKFLWIR